MHDGSYTERKVWVDLPATPDGARLFVTMCLESPEGSGAQHYYVIEVPPAMADRRVSVVFRQVDYPPPPESTQDRRKRLMTEVLNRAREAGKLGLTTDDQTNTVNALMAALSDEFEYDEEMGPER